MDGCELNNNKDKKMNLDLFKNNQDLYQATLHLFKEQLNIKINPLPDKFLSAKDYFKSLDNPLFDTIQKLYTVAIVNDHTFENQDQIEDWDSKIDYKTIFILAIDLKQELTRSKLATLTRLLNKRANTNDKGNPVIAVFRYHNKITLSSLERQARDPKDWREGEKISATKVSMLKDVDIEKPHRAHLDILKDLGKHNTQNFDELYKHWQKVLNTKELNKKFYQELSNWYFWATQHVTFPNQPTAADAHKKKADLEDLLQEHRATNVIRMLTRLLFVWFIKEKKLVPEDLFELDALQKDILNDISPYQERGMFKERNKESIYYKAILQNLFFATLNCPIKPDGLDKRTRDFRRDKNYGDDFGNDWLFRYKKYFKNPEKFLQLMNSVVPFLNGGLFECLDEKHKKIYVDGFSDQMAKGEQLIVPDYLFFGVEEETDLSDIVGIKDKKYKQAAVKGLINILKSYKFTIAENTPIEEDVALDPELLGKVFENLLASFNPETKTTARKQTGSFYTPREIVNYMVDESLIAYLKNAIYDWGGLDDEALDKELHVLTSFDSKVPFTDNSELQRAIITALSTCTILDPACGSGAFPMGILQKMVHILQKLDPDNKAWREVQESKAKKEAEEAFDIDDKQVRKERLFEINEAFDQSINDPDYARKLFLIENCIYGVDIQPIATQISKLRFFISLVVEQKPSDTPENNFNIRPLPNLETKFVAANTLIGIEDGGLFETDEVKKLEKELKIVRQKIFSLKSKERKIAWREKDKELREKLSTVLKNHGLPLNAAEKLANWDPYDQNASSPFFDPEWMFGIKEGFDVVIGNPPYTQVHKGIFSSKQFPYSEGKDKGKQNLYKVFVEASINFSIPETGVACMIVQSSLMCDLSSTYTRELLLKRTQINEILEFPKLAPTKEGQVFENVLQGTCIYRLTNIPPDEKHHFKISINNDVTTLLNLKFEKLSQEALLTFYPNTNYIPLVVPGDFKILDLIKNHSSHLITFIQVNSQGDLNLTNSRSHFEGVISDVKLFRGKHVHRFQIDSETEEFVDNNFLREVVERNSKTKTLVCQQITGTTDKYRLHFAVTRLDEKYLLGNSINKVVLKDTSKSEALAVLLNSKLLDYTFRKTSTNNHVMGYEIDVFPIANELHKKISLTSLFYRLINKLVFNTSNLVNFFEEVSNALIFNLYFPDHMKERGIDVLESVERDIDEVMRGREFEKLSDTEKEQVVEQLHTKWSHPDNEVVKRMGMFKEKSPEILKVILES
jgi:Alw26I/Eco31I/Esp3I family type II restriction m6 adenine DNA methyltransferase